MFNQFPGGFGRMENTDKRLCKQEPITELYPLGDLGSNDCPPGFVPILDADLCETALQTHPELASFPTVDSPNWAGTRPHGCFVHTPNSRVHFNHRPGGVAPDWGGRIQNANQDRRLCTRAP